MSTKITRTCDRCGKKATDNGTYISEVCWIWTRQHDLCYECLEAFKKFMKGTKVE